jgi:hypothetical protein
VTKLPANSTQPQLTCSWAAWVQPELSRFSEEETEIMVEFQVRNNLRSPLSFIGTLDQCSRQAEL